jgi:hypothetical protein
LWFEHLNAFSCTAAEFHFENLLQISLLNGTRVDFAGKKPLQHINMDTKCVKLRNCHPLERGSKTMTMME